MFVVRLLRAPPAQVDPVLVIVHEEVPRLAAAVAGTHIELHLCALGLGDRQEAGERDQECSHRFW